MACRVTSSRKNWSVLLGSIALSSLAYVAYLAAVGLSEENLLTVLRWSARAAFLLLMVVFIARPLHQLLKKPWTAKLLRRRRLLGIAFAGLHTAHLGFIVYRARISEDFVFNPAENLAGALVYTVILAMLVTSWDSTTRLLGRRNWKILHTVGLYALFIAFTDAVRPYSLASATGINGLLLGIAIAALLIRLAAYLQKQRREAPATPA
jgi:DMSO/TMAO reductase YedYZ heme-binding membrane subunit